MKVKASSGRLLPNQTYFVGCVAICGLKNSPYVRRTRPLMPSAPTIRSAPSNSATSRTSRSNSNRTPRAWQRRWRMLSNSLREVQSGRPAADDGVAHRLVDHLGQLIDLLDAGRRRKEDQLVATGIFVAADEVDDRSGRGQIARRDLLGERSRECVVAPQVLGPGIRVAIAEREIA